MELIITLHDFPESLYFLKAIYLGFFPCKQFILHKHCTVTSTSTQPHTHTHTHTNTHTSVQVSLMTASCQGTAVGNPQAISAQLTTILRCVEKVYPCPPTCLVCVRVCLCVGPSVCLSPLFRSLLSSPSRCP